MCPALKCFLLTLKIGFGSRVPIRPFGPRSFFFLRVYNYFIRVISFFHLSVSNSIIIKIYANK